MNISFVIPAYNAASMLPDAVRSIVDGNFRDGDEILIVEDCSSDNTAGIADELALAYSPHIRVIRNPVNKGCPASRNIGIEEARNELIFNLDADNILASGNIAKLQKVLELDSEADVAAFTTYNYFKEIPIRVTHRWDCKTGIFTLADLFSGMINPAPGGNFLYRKSAWEKVGRYAEYGKGLHEAWGFSLALLLSGAKFLVVPETFYYHRYSHASLFVRESKKAGEEQNILARFMAPVLPLLSATSRTYIESNPQWFTLLDRHPLLLADGTTGKNGVKHRTFYGILSGVTRKIMQLTA